MISPKTAKRSLLSNNAITPHSEKVLYWLKKLGHSEISIESIRRCNKHTNIELIKNCEGCEDSPEIIELKCRCNRRTCLICSETRKRKIRRIYLHYLKNLPTDKTLSLYFITFSPENYTDSFMFVKKIKKKDQPSKEVVLKGIEAGLEHIKISYNKFLRLNYIKEKVLGTLYIIETRNKNRFGEGKGWNIHIHALLYGKRLDNRIRGKCNDCNQNLMKFDYNTKEYYCASKKCLSKNVVVKKDSKLVSLWKKSSQRDVNIKIEKLSSISFLLNYLLKYISANKNEFMRDKDIARYIIATNKKRLIGRTGFFYKHPPKKQKPICYKCKKPVEYILDFDAIRILRESKNRPKNLWDYFNDTERRYN